MFRDLFRIYKSPYPKRRLGKQNDGGYVICDIPDIRYDMLLSAGICDDISFEEDFLTMYPTAHCTAFDGTVATFPATTKPIWFVKKNIGPQMTETETNLTDLMMGGTNIFLKMDIEGAEVDWIYALPPGLLDRVAQITMEWHNPFYRPIEQFAFHKLLQTHVLVHFHGNNCRGFETVDGIQIPYTFECTYIHKRLYTGPIEFNTTSIPSSLDMPCDAGKPDLSMDWEPFVKKS